MLRLPADMEAHAEHLEALCSPLSSFLAGSRATLLVVCRADIRLSPGEALTGWLTLEVAWHTRDCGASICKT